MSQLAPLLEKLKESGAASIYFAPNEQGVAIDGDARRPVPGGPVKGATILEALSELMSADDIQGLSSTRPRIIRHEHDGEDFVLEVVRQANGVALGIRQAQRPPQRGLRDSVRRDDPPKPPERAPQAQAQAAPARQSPPQPPSDQPKLSRSSRRMRAAAMTEEPPPPTLENKRRPSAGIELDLGSRAGGGGIGLAHTEPKIQVQEERNDTKPVKKIEAPNPNASVAPLTQGPSIDSMLTIAREAATTAGREAAREVAREIARDVAREAAREVAHAAAIEVARDVLRDVARSGGGGGASVAPAADTRGRPNDGATPARSGPARVDAMLRDMLTNKASDLHLSSEAHAVLRIDGEIHFSKNKPLTSKEIVEMVHEIMPPRARHDFETLHDADFAYEIPGLARFRVNVFQDRRGTGAVMRQIPIEILTAEKLGLPKACLDLCWLSKGLVLVTGPTGSGKSTTLAAMIDFINKNRSDHIITIEDPVEFVHQNQKCLVNQREVGQHTKSFKNALRAALREDPDIVLVGEMRDLETIAIAIETAETGHLVFGTLHTTTAVSTVDRIIDQFPSDRQDQIRVMLSESLKGVVAQILCPKIGGGRIAAHEILLGSTAVASLIREGKTFQIASIMQTSKGAGMVTMNDSLLQLVQKKLVDPKAAYVKAVDKNGFVGMLRSAGIAPPV